MHASRCFKDIQFYPRVRACEDGRDFMCHQVPFRPDREIPQILGLSEMQPEGTNPRSPGCVVTG